MIEKHLHERTADTADLSTALRSGRDDKGEGRLWPGVPYQQPLMQGEGMVRSTSV
jgi:hypothetical protein